MKQHLAKEIDLSGSIHLSGSVGLWVVIVLLFLSAAAMTSFVLVRSAHDRATKTALTPRNSGSVLLTSPDTATPTPATTTDDATPAPVASPQTAADQELQTIDTSLNNLD